MMRIPNPQNPRHFAFNIVRKLLLHYAKLFRNVGPAVAQSVQQRISDPIPSVPIVSDTPIDLPIASTHATVDGRPTRDISARYSSFQYFHPLKLPYG
jgi:hypothetical protein